MCHMLRPYIYIIVLITMLVVGAISQAMHPVLKVTMVHIVQYAKPGIIAPKYERDV
jgi:hypothetical protein